MGLAHTCSDGTRIRLQRHGPVGTVVGVWFECDHCGYSRAAMTIEEETRRTLATITFKKGVNAMLAERRKAAGR